MTDVRYHTSGQTGRSSAAPQHTKTGDFGTALQEAVRDNPVSAALIGMGVLWMFMGGSDISLFGGGGRKSVFHIAGRGAGQVGGIVSDTATRAGASVGRGARTAGDMLSQTGEFIQQGSTGARDAVSRLTGQAVDAVSSAYDATTDTASRTAGTISNASAALQESGARLGNALQQTLFDAFERQPLLLGAIGLAIGGGIAASIPTTEAEKRVIGEASKTVRDAVAEKAAQVKEMAEAAVQEAKAQGLTPEAAKAALRAVGGKIAQGAEGSQADSARS